jgi:hypothetical protein
VAPLLADPLVWHNFLYPLKLDINDILSRGKGNFTKLFCVHLIIKFLNCYGLEMIENAVLTVPCEGPKVMAVPTDKVLLHLGLACHSCINYRGSIHCLHLHWFLLGKSYDADVYFALEVLLFSPTLPLFKNLAHLSAEAHNLIFVKRVSDVAHSLGLCLEKVCAEDQVHWHTGH